MQLKIISIEDKLEILKQVFNVENIDENTSISTLQTWDSLNHVLLIIAIQEAFNCEIDTKQVIELTSVSAIIQFLENHKSHG